MLNVAYSKYICRAVAVNIRQKIKNCAFIYLYENNRPTAEKSRKRDFASISLLKNKGTKSIGKSPQF